MRGRCRCRRRWRRRLKIDGDFCVEMKTVTSQRCRGVRGCPRQSRFRVSEARGSRLCDKYISALYESDLYNIGWPRTGLTYTSRANRAQRSSSPFRAQCHSKMHAKPMYFINAYIKYIFIIFLFLYINTFIFIIFFFNFGCSLPPSFRLQAPSSWPPPSPSSWRKTRFSGGVP